MKTKSTFLARKALASPTVVARQPQLATGRDGTDLPMPANGGNLTSTSRSSGDAGQYLVVRIYEGPLIARAETNSTAGGRNWSPVSEVAS